MITGVTRVHRLHDPRKYEERREENSKRFPLVWPPLCPCLACLIIFLNKDWHGAFSESPSIINDSHSRNLNKYFKIGRMKREINYIVDNVPAGSFWFFLTNSVQ